MAAIVAWPKWNWQIGKSQNNAFNYGREIVALEMRMS
jgi:hypothetical protein